MSTPQPVLVLLDLSALLGSSLREWQEYSRIGNCYVPQMVYEEIEYLTGRAPEPQVEKAAREFMRFFPDSGWQLTNAHATHPAIAPPGGASLSKQARLVVAVAQCAYGFALEQPNNLVVFVSNTQPILQRIPSLGTPNFCGITRAAFLQWVRTGERPPAVTAQQQTFSTVGAATANGQAKIQNQAIAETPSQSSLTAVSTMTGPASAARPASSDKKSRGTGALSRLIGGLITLAVIAAVGLVAWRFIQPASFLRFWQQLGLPSQPAQPSNPTRK